MSATAGISDKELTEKIHEMNLNRIYLDQHSDTIRKEFPNVYIAVFKGKIVGNDSDMKKLIIHMKEKFGNIDTVLIEFINGEDYYIIL